MLNIKRSKYLILLGSFCLGLFLAGHSFAETKTGKPAAPKASEKKKQDIEVVLKTSKGDIHIQLHPERAPKTVENFLKYVNSGFYNKVIFHRVIPNFMVQTGGLTDKFQRKPTTSSVVNESYDGLPNKLGSVAMARTMNPDSASSQFFINVKDNPFLDASAGKPGYTVFGTVTKGLEYAIAISKVERGGMHPMHRDAPKKHIYIDKAYVVNKGAIKQAAKMEKMKMSIKPPAPPKPPMQLQTKEKDE